MRNIVNANEGLNIMLNEIVNQEMDKELDDMISVVKDWNKNSDVISCETVINMLKSRKSK